MTTGTVDAFDGSAELLGFGHIDAGTTVSFVSEAGGTQQNISLGVDLTSGTYAKLTCYYDGVRFHLYKDDIFLSSTVQTSLNSSTAMLFQLFFEAVEAKANSFDVQSVFLAVEL